MKITTNNDIFSSDFFRYVKKELSNPEHILQLVIHLNENHYLFIEKNLEAFKLLYCIRISIDRLIRFDPNKAIVIYRELILTWRKINTVNHNSSRVAILGFAGLVETFKKLNLSDAKIAADLKDIFIGFVKYRLSVFSYRNIILNDGFDTFTNIDMQLLSCVGGLSGIFTGNHSQSPIKKIDPESAGATMELWWEIKDKFMDVQDLLTNWVREKAKYGKEIDYLLIHFWIYDLYKSDHSEKSADIYTLYVKYMETQNGFTIAAAYARSWLKKELHLDNLTKRFLNKKTNNYHLDDRITEKQVRFALEVIQAENMAAVFKTQKPLKEMITFLENSCLSAFKPPFQPSSITDILLNFRVGLYFFEGKMQIDSLKKIIAHCAKEIFIDTIEIQKALQNQEKVEQALNCSNLSFGISNWKNPWKAIIQLAKRNQLQTNKERLDRNIAYRQHQFYAQIEKSIWHIKGWLSHRVWTQTKHYPDGTLSLSIDFFDLISYCHKEPPQQWEWNFNELIQTWDAATPQEKEHMPQWLAKSDRQRTFDSCQSEFKQWRHLAFVLSELIGVFKQMPEPTDDGALHKLSQEIERVINSIKSPAAQLLDEHIPDEFLSAVLDNKANALLNQSIQQWLSEWFKTLLISGNNITQAWQAWCTRIDSLLSNNILGVPHLNQPELEKGLHEWVAYRLKQHYQNSSTIGGVNPEIVFNLIMHQTEPLHAPFTDLLSNETTLGIWNQLEQALDAEFAKETTYYADPNRTVWPPFVIYSEFMEKILPPLPDVSQVQKVLTEDQVMVLLYETDGGLHSLCIYRNRSICIELEPHWNEMMEAWRSSYNNLSNIIDEMRNQDSSTAWKAASQWIEVFEKLLRHIESASTILLYAGTTSNLPWEWALEQISHPECVNLQRIISVKHWLDNKAECQTTDSYDINHRLLVQGCLPTSQDPDFTAMVNMWMSNDIQDSQQPLRSITETLAALQLSPELHYFGHGFSNEQSPSANFLSMGDNKLFARLLALCNPTTSLANISACHSAHSVNNIGIANLLLAGGVQSCIACLWEVEALSLLFFNSILSKAVQENPLSREIFLSSIESLKAVKWKDIKDWLGQAEIQKDMPDYAKFWNTLSIIEEPDDNEKPFHHPYFFACYIWMGK